jgi:hypothetical protein
MANIQAVVRAAELDLITTGFEAQGLYRGVLRRLPMRCAGNSAADLSCRPGQKEYRLISTLPLGRKMHMLCLVNWQENIIV